MPRLKFKHKTKDGRIIKFKTKAHRDRWLRGMNAGRNTQTKRSKKRKHPINVKGNILSSESSLKNKRHKFSVSAMTEFGQAIKIVEDEPANRGYIPKKLKTKIRAPEASGVIESKRLDSRGNEISSLFIQIDPVTSSSSGIAIETLYRKWLKSGKDHLLEPEGDEKRVLLNNLHKELKKEGIIIQKTGTARTAKGGGLDRAIQKGLKEKDRLLKTKLKEEKFTSKNLPDSKKLSR
jgi:hypothetical protein